MNLIYWQMFFFTHFPILLIIPQPLTFILQPHVGNICCMCVSVFTLWSPTLVNIQVYLLLQQQRRAECSQTDAVHFRAGWAGFLRHKQQTNRPSDKTEQTRSKSTGSEVTKYWQFPLNDCRLHLTYFALLVLRNVYFTYDDRWFRV